MSKPFITGLYGCSCHPFESWIECDRHHKQRFEIGQNVKNRHNGKMGSIHINWENGFVSVKYGPKQSDIELEHVARLIKQ